MEQKKKSKRGRKSKGRYKFEIESTITNNCPDFKGKYAVYALTTECNCNSYYYIGSTKSKLNRRYNNHIYNAKVNGTPKEQWIWFLIRTGQKMVMVLIEDNISTQDEAFEREQHYINYFFDKRHPLKNQIKAGLGTPGRIAKQESKAKASASLKELWNCKKRANTHNNDEFQEPVNDKFEQRTAA